ncbi:hypothetical protein PM082_023370 [Marasmius tenuissimus]|nr:hypothetical protein PM082_023370 [Marasmius tenuissimus]
MTTTFDKIVIEALDTKECYPGWLIKITDVLDELQVLDIATGIETRSNPIIKAKGESDEDFKERQKSEDVSILNWDKKDKNSVANSQLGSALGAVDGLRLGSLSCSSRKNPS